MTYAQAARLVAAMVFAGAGVMAFIFVVDAGMPWCPALLLGLATSVGSAVISATAVAILAWYERRGSS